MEFLNNNTTPPPKNLYPCLATIVIQPSGGWTRRLSASSNTSGGEEESGGGSALKRIVSGGRRKSSFGAGTGDAEQQAANRRVSIAPPSADGTVSKGTWFWRVQVGVTDNALLLLPLSQPPNPLLTSPPQALSQAMPAHSNAKNPAHTSHTSPEVREKEMKEDGKDEGLVDKMKNLFRKGSTTSKSTDDSTTTAVDSAATGATSATEEGGGNDRILDQTAQGDQLPSAKANAMGATNNNGSAEVGWPGVIQGEKLQAVLVPLSAVDKHKITTGGGKKDGHWVNVPIHTALGSAAGGTDTTAKTGFIKLEFDKDWIGGKAEAELLHHQLTSAADRPPAAQTLKLGGTGASAAGHPEQPAVNPGGPTGLAPS